MSTPVLSCPAWCVPAPLGHLPGGDGATAASVEITVHEADLAEVEISNGAVSVTVSVEDQVRHTRAGAIVDRTPPRVHLYGPDSGPEPTADDADRLAGVLSVAAATERCCRRCA